MFPHLRDTEAQSARVAWVLLFICYLCCACLRPFSLAVPPRCSPPALPLPRARCASLELRLRALIGRNLNEGGVLVGRRGLFAFRWPASFVCELAEIRGSEARSRPWPRLSLTRALLGVFVPLSRPAPALPLPPPACVRVFALASVSFARSAYCRRVRLLAQEYNERKMRSCAIASPVFLALKRARPDCRAKKNLF